MRLLILPLCTALLMLSQVAAATEPANTSTATSTIAMILRIRYRTCLTCTVLCRGCSSTGPPMFTIRLLSSVCEAKAHTFLFVVSARALRAHVHVDSVS